MLEFICDSVFGLCAKEKNIPNDAMFTYKETDVISISVLLCKVQGVNLPCDYLTMQRFPCHMFA